MRARLASSHQGVPEMVEEYPLSALLTVDACLPVSVRFDPVVALMGSTSGGRRRDLVHRKIATAATMTPPISTASETFMARHYPMSGAHRQLHRICS